MVSTLFSNSNHSFFQIMIVTQFNKTAKLNSIYTYLQRHSQNLQKHGLASSTN